MQKANAKSKNKDFLNSFLFHLMTSFPSFHSNLINKHFTRHLWFHFGTTSWKEMESFFSLFLLLLKKRRTFSARKKNELNFCLKLNCFSFSRKFFFIAKYNSVWNELDLWIQTILTRIMSEQIELSDCYVLLKFKSYIIRGSFYSTFKEFWRRIFIWSGYELLIRYKWQWLG